MSKSSKKTQAVEVVALADISAVPAMTPTNLIQQAIASGAGIEVLERLMALQERWENNLARKAYNSAMADLRSDLPPIIKNRTVDYTSTKGHTYYRYEDLHAVTEALSPVMAKHGLSFRWRTQTDKPDVVTVTCIISHRDGHSEETTLTASNDHSGSKNEIQSLGSAVAYLQRYTLKAAVGVAASNDDDGDQSGEGSDSKREPSPGAFLRDAQRESKAMAAEKANGGQPARPANLHERHAAHNHLEQVIEEYCKARNLDVKTEGPALLKKMSAFKGQDGRMVPGVDNILQLSEKAAIITRKKIEEEMDESRNWRADLAEAIKDYCTLNPNTDKIAILTEVTGKSSFREITPAMAKAGLEKFNKQYGANN